MFVGVTILVHTVCIGILYSCILMYYVYAMHGGIIRIIIYRSNVFA